MYQYNVNMKTVREGKTFYILLDSQNDLSVAELDNFKLELEKLIDKNFIQISSISKMKLYDVSKPQEKSRLLFSYEFEENGVPHINQRNSIPFIKESLNSEQMGNILKNAINMLVGTNNEIIYEPKIVIK